MTIETTEREAEERGRLKAEQNFRFLGCDQAQLMWLVRDYEARTGQRAETINPRDPVTQ